MRHTAVILAFIAVLQIAHEAIADTCVPARTSQELSELEADWRGALERLVDATRDADQPWGCPEATLSLFMEEDGATLRVERTSAAPISRHLADPDDVVVMGKAMLARALPPTPPLEPVDTLSPDSDDSDAGSVDEASLQAAAYVHVTGAVRYAGISDALALGVAGRGTIPIDRWSVRFGLRYLQLAADLGDRTAAQDFDYSELTIAGGFGYALVTVPVRLRVGIFGALAIVDMDLEEEVSAADEIEVESGAIDGRIGVELGLSVPLWGPLSLVTSIDADVAPASFGNVNRRVDPALPPLPAYMVGTDVGLEVAIP